MNSIFVVGYPGRLGGADTELWHTVRLWRQFGLPVTMVPTWRPNPHQQHLLDALGVPTAVVAGPDQLAEIPGLPGSIVVSFCNAEFLKHAHVLKRLGCRLVWANCMTWIFPAEIAYYEQHGPFDAWMFQSNFQQQALAPKLVDHGAAAHQFHHIRGAFTTDEFAFAPRAHGRGEPFYLGRLARPDLDKWSSNLWPIYSAVQYAPKRARVMAWDERLTGKCGAPPVWAEALPANAEPAAKFLASLHCLLPINGGARENWPRAGLEAMAAGVPIVAQRDWGWCEMIEHGVSGFLGGDDCELAHYAALLAHDEERRLHMALAARRRLVEVLAHPETIWKAWQKLFSSLEPGCVAAAAATAA